MASMRGLRQSMPSSASFLSMDERSPSKEGEWAFLPVVLSLLMCGSFPQFAASNKSPGRLCRGIVAANSRRYLGAIVLDTTAESALRLPAVSLAAIEK
jgi:hypothetical protein